MRNGKLPGTVGFPSKKLAGETWNLEPEDSKVCYPAPWGLATKLSILPVFAVVPSVVVTAGCFLRVAGEGRAANNGTSW
jgi:hypothetical protein